MSEEGRSRDAVELEERPRKSGEGQRVASCSYLYMIKISVSEHQLYIVIVVAQSPDPVKRKLTASRTNKVHTCPVRHKAVLDIPPLTLSLTAIEIPSAP